MGAVPMRYLLPFLLFVMSSSPFAQDHSLCVNCHAQGVVEDQAVMARIRPALPQLCINCHQDRVAQGEHIINVKPVTAHPSTLPLLNGMVSCTTCHDPHGRQPAQLRLDAAHLCQDCHSQ